MALASEANLLIEYRFRRPADINSRLAMEGMRRG
jgi:hypothetical protein